MLQYGESLFGVEAPKDPLDEEKDEEDGLDIEASIQQELESFKESKPKERQVFTPVSTGLECVFFMKTAKPIDALRLTQQMCQDAKDCQDPRERKTKYINRLTPVQDTDKATESGIERVARSVLGKFFELNREDGKDGEDGQNGGDVAESPACTVRVGGMIYCVVLLRETDESAAITVRHPA
jgi:tRNA acetyltransferase TAN1